MECRGSAFRSSCTLTAIIGCPVQQGPKRWKWWQLLPQPLLLGITVRIKRENKIQWGMNFKPGLQVRRMRVEQNSIRRSRSAQCSGWEFSPTSCFKDQIMSKLEGKRYMVHWFPTSEMSSPITSSRNNRESGVIAPLPPHRFYGPLCIRIMLKLRFLGPIPDLPSQSLDPGICIFASSLDTPMQHSIWKPLP